jgi:CHAT domain-containing protein
MRLHPLLLTAAFGAAATASAEVMLLEVQPDTPAAVARLRQGDVLASWRRTASPHAPAAEGVFADPFDVILVGLEQAPLGPVQVAGRRGEEPFEVEVPFGSWLDLRAAPLLEPARRASFETAMRHWQEGEREGALRRFAELAANETGGARRRTWWSHFLAERSRDAGRPVEAARHFTGAVATAVAAGEDAERVALLRRDLGELLLFQLGRHGDAERELRLAYDLRRARTERGLAVADSLHLLSEVARLEQRYGEALHLTNEVVVMVEALAPSSYPHAVALVNAGYLHWRLGDYTTAEALYNRALPVFERATRSDQNHGLVVLAYIARARGEDERYRELIGRDIAWRLSLGDPSQHALAHSYAASLASDLGDLERAESETVEALEIRRRLYSELSHPVAASVAGLGLLARRRGDLDRAQELLEEALAIFERLAPSGASSAELLRELGELAEERGDAATSEQRYRAAVQIADRVIPATEEAARAHDRLARLHRRSGNARAAADELEAALRALEAQTRRLGGSDERRVGFAARHGRYYRELLTTYLELGETERAFEVLERSRSRQLLELLHQRELDWRREIPPRIAAELSALDTEYASTLDRLRASPADDPAVDALLADLDRLAGRRRNLRDRLAAAAPRIAAAHLPEPLDLAGAQAALEPGTLLLTYSVGAEATTLFALGPGDEGLRALSSAIGEEELRRSVVRWRRDLERVDRLRRAERRELVQALSRQLLRGIADRLLRAERLLVIPDGPLHLAPFAALVDPLAPDRLLVERLPLAYAPSLSVLAELRARARVDRPISLRAFGDPLYTATGQDAPSPQLAGLEREGFELVSLPATRREVAGIAELFPDRARVWTGAEATEERAKQLEPSASLVHFACHARIDERFPMESALVLARPDTGGPRRENGLLQTWEIFDQMRLDADLVTLSACQTALGTVVTGEGILGLTRAFHYAGARGVLASLWRIDDDSTAELMRRLYGALASGLDPAAALRRAQLALLAGSIEVERHDDGGDGDGELLEVDFSDPYHWAAFRLSGE